MGWLEQLEELSLIYKYRPGHENTVPDALWRIPTYSSGSANDCSPEIAYLVYKLCNTKVPVLLEYIKGDKKVTNLSFRYLTWSSEYRFACDFGEVQQVWC